MVKKSCWTDADGNMIYTQDGKVITVEADAKKIDALRKIGKALSAQNIKYNYPVLKYIVDNKDTVIAFLQAL